MKQIENPFKVLTIPFGVNINTVLREASQNGIRAVCIKKRKYLFVCSDNINKILTLQTIWGLKADKDE